MKINEIILAAGQILKERYFEKTGHSTKERYHLLSDVDLEMNDFLTRHLQSSFPDYSIFSEEDSEVQKSSDSRLIVDPIDGTTNFITGNPYFAISIALEVQGKIVEGHVYNPVSNEYFFASVNDDNAFLNGHEISISKTTSISDSIIAFGFSANMKVINAFYSKWSRLFERCKKGIGWIAPALSICNVARGRVECFIDSGSSMEGQAAASFILEKAKGKLFNIDFNEYSHKSVGGIFITPTLVSEIQKMYDK